MHSIGLPSVILISPNQSQLFKVSFYFKINTVHFISTFFKLRQVAFAAEKSKNATLFPFVFFVQLSPSWQQILNLFASLSLSLLPSSFFFHGNCLVSANIRADKALCVCFPLCLVSVSVCAGMHSLTQVPNIQQQHIINQGEKKIS